MGSEISRIEKEFILNSVSDNGIPVRVHGNKLHSAASIKSVNEDFVEIVVEGPTDSLIAVGDTIRIYVSYFGHVMTFECVVRGISENIIRADFPEKIYKNLKRKYERVVAPANSSVSFQIQDTKVELKFPKTEEFDPVEPPEFIDDFDLSNMESLVDGFREKIKRKASVNTITMFRERLPSGFEEQIISQTGKILYIPNTAGRFPENDYQMGGRIITRGMLLQQAQIDVNEEITQDRLPSLLAEKQAKGIYAEIFCPIIFHEYAVGYIYLAKTDDSEGVFDHDLLETTYQFSKVLAYSLKTSGYFKEDIPELREYQGEIIDISASGLLFANSAQTLEDALVLYTDVELNLRFPERGMKIGARVMRKYSDDNLTYFGIQFMEMKPEDMRFLFGFVYGRDLTIEDEELWEGGSEPPELDLG